MDLQTRKISFIQEFLRLQNEEIISGLEKVLRRGKAALYEESLNPMSLEQFNDEIDLALEESKEGKAITVAALKSKIEKWA